MSERTDEVIVVGSGLAGLTCALALAPRPVTLITKTASLAGGSSLWAQGGIAAAVGPDDSPEMHAADTLSAGAGLSDPELVHQMTSESANGLRWLLGQGIPFDRALDGTLALAQEAAHGTPRVVHAGGDATGLILMRSLIDRVVKSSSINVLQDTFAQDLLVRNGRVHGLMAFNSTTGWTLHHAPSVVLATGGIGTTWWHTTNPVEATGDGLAMAARAGATLADLEFVQFHPTALDVKQANNGASLPLLTEALRGAGALLLDESGARFMVDEHVAAEMAPRDVVARAIHQRIRRGQSVFLDLRPVLSAGLGTSFPQAIDVAEKAGFDPNIEPLPVLPAAHYHMGGVQTDHRGRTSLDSLWACGEVATTGVHGANRLASNSLLEALTYALRVAADIQENATQPDDRIPPTFMPPRIPPVSARDALQSIGAATRKLMSQTVGILRSGTELQEACTELSDLEAQLTKIVDRHTPNNQPGSNLVAAYGEIRNRLLVARLVTLAALRREESRGAHHRNDFPTARLDWQHRQAISIEALLEAH